MASIREYKENIETTLLADCDEIIDMIKTLILSKPATEEPKAFFVKMHGDYYRYQAEITTGEKHERLKQEAKKSYEEASMIEMPACSPIKLGLALNFSVFYYEIFKEPK